MATKENAPFAFAKDKVAFSRAVEELRAEKANLNDPAVIEERYNEILKGGSKKKGAKKEDAPEEDTVEDEVEEDEVEPEKPAKESKGKGKGKKK